MKRIKHVIKTGFPIFSELFYKVVLVVSMAVCHSVFFIVMPLVQSSSIVDVWHAMFLWIYMRIAYFPLLFVFLFPVEAFFHTSDRLKYIKGILIMAFVSEIPFDLARLFSEVLSGKCAFSGGLADVLNLFMENRHFILKDQNVMFTIAIGFATIWGIDFLLREISDVINSQTMESIMKYLSIVCITTLGGFLSYLIRSDHSWWMVTGMVLIYLFHNNRFLMCLVPSCFLIVTSLCFLHHSLFVSSVVGGALLFLYSGNRGHISKTGKWFFYWFYPAQFIIIFIIQTMYLCSRG